MCEGPSSVCIFPGVEVGKGVPSNGKIVSALIYVYGTTELKISTWQGCEEHAYRASSNFASKYSGTVGTWHGQAQEEVL